MDQLVEQIHNLQNLDNLFFSALGSTTLLYFLSLAYLRGLFGPLPLADVLPDWDSSIEGWLLGLLGTIGSLIFALFPSTAVTAFLGWYMIGIFLLLIVLWFLTIRLMYHDLPSWLANTLLAFMIGIVVLGMLLLFLLGLLTPVPGDEFLYAAAAALYLAFFAAILALIITLLYKLLRAVYRWAKGSWPGSFWRKYVDGEPQLPTGGGDGATGDPGVSNPDGALADPGGPGSGQAATLPPESCIVIEFRANPIDDHLTVPDLRIVRRPTDVPITVEVSNDGTNWKPCERDTGSVPAEDYDVPWRGSPWRKVRICNRGSRPVLISDVLDLGN